MKKFLSVFIFFFILALLLFAWQAVYLNISYSTNDDAAMQLIAGGTAGILPSPFLYLSSIMYGKVLQSLYLSDIRVNWYFVGIYGAYSFLFACLHSYIYSFVIGYKKFILLLFSLVVWVFLLMQVSFTMLAILSCSVSFIYLHQQEGVFSNRLFFCMGLCLLFMAANFRYEALAVFLCLYLAPLVNQYVTKNAFGKLAILVSFIILLIGQHKIENVYMSQAVGYDVEAYVRATETIIDNPNDIHPQALENVGWKAHHLDLIIHFFFIDVDIFSFEKMTAFAHQIQATHSVHTAVFIFLFSMWGVLPFFLLVLVLLFVLYKNAGNTLSLYLGVAFCLLSFFLAFRFRLPYRVLLPMILGLIWIVITKAYFTQYIRVVYTMLGLVAIFCLVETVKLHQHNANKNARLNQYLAYFYENPQYIYQISGVEVPWEQLAGFSSKLNGKNVHLLLAGWPIGTPIYFDNLKKYDISDHLMALAKRDNIVLISGSDTLKATLKELYREDYKMEVYFEVVHSELNMYRIKILDP